MSRFDYKDNIKMRYNQIPFYTRLYTISEHGTDMLQVNTLLMQRWELVAKIGVGGHSEVYCAYDRQLKRDVAIKCEREDTRLSNEVAVLRMLSDVDNFCKYIQYQPTYIVDFLVMDLQGPDLKQVLHHYRPLSLKTVIHIGLQMLAAIERLHAIGYVHGDIKPSSFLTGTYPQMEKIYLIDFGLSRKLKENNITPFRRQVRKQTNGDTTPSCEIVKAKFQGTMKYGSPQSHLGYRLGKRDDLWSLLYTLLDMRNELPWTGVTKWEKILDMKNEFANNLIKTYLSEQGLGFKSHIEKLLLPQNPDYVLLRQCLADIVKDIPEEDQKNVEWVTNPQKLWDVEFVAVPIEDEEPKEEPVKVVQEAEQAETPEQFRKQISGSQLSRGSSTRSALKGKSERREDDDEANIKKTLAFKPLVKSADVIKKAESTAVAPATEEFVKVPLVVSKLIPRGKGASFSDANNNLYYTQRPSSRPSDSTLVEDSYEPENED